MVTLLSSTTGNGSSTSSGADAGSTLLSSLSAIYSESNTTAISQAANGSTTQFTSTTGATYASQFSVYA